MTDSDPRAERVTESRRIYSGRIVGLREDTVRMPNGRTAGREVVEHADVVAIVPLDRQGNVVMVRQYRLPAGATLLEVPAGGVDEGEEIEAAAQRELQEETGYRAEKLERLGGLFVSPGYCTEFVHLFLASGLIEDALEADADEDIAVERVPLAEAVRMAEAGDIRDGKSIAGILLTARFLK